MTEHSYSSSRKIKYESSCRDIFEELRQNQLRRNPELRKAHASYPFTIWRQASLAEYGGGTG